jgi:hypothetical protein
MIDYSIEFGQNVVSKQKQKFLNPLPKQPQHYQPIFNGKSQ